MEPWPRMSVGWESLGIPWCNRCMASQSFAHARIIWYGLMTNWNWERFEFENTNTAHQSACYGPVRLNFRQRCHCLTVRYHQGRHAQQWHYFSAIFFGGILENWRTKQPALSTASFWQTPNHATMIPIVRSNEPIANGNHHTGAFADFFRKAKDGLTMKCLSTK